MASTKLFGIYSNGMILQRNTEIVIEGWETVNSEVKVSMCGNSVTVPVEDGVFKAVLPPMDVAVDTELTVEGSECITLKDVCIGDVYMLTGQSNMELPVSRTYDLNKEEIEAKDYPYIRQYRLSPDLEIPLQGKASICKLPESRWVSATGIDKNEISAVGFYSAKRLYEKNNVPVGLILSAQGGSNIESWMCEEDLYATGTSEDEIAPYRGEGVLKAYVAEGNERTNAWRNDTVVKDFSVDEALKDAVTVELPAIVMKDFSGNV